MDAPIVYTNALYTNLGKTQQEAIDAYVHILRGKDPLSKALREAFSNMPDITQVSAHASDIQPFLKTLYGRERSSRMSKHISFAPNADTALLIQVAKTAGPQGGQLEFCIEAPLEELYTFAKQNVFLNHYLAIATRNNEEIHSIRERQYNLGRLELLFAPHDKKYIDAVPNTRGEARLHMKSNTADIAAAIHTNTLSTIRALAWSITNPFRRANHSIRQPAIIAGVIEGDNHVRAAVREHWHQLITDYNVDPITTRDELAQFTRHLEIQGADFLNQYVSRKDAQN